MRFRPKESSALYSTILFAKIKLSNRSVLWFWKNISNKGNYASGITRPLLELESFWTQMDVLRHMRQLSSGHIWVITALWVYFDKFICILKRIENRKWDKYNGFYYFLLITESVVKQKQIPGTSQPIQGRKGKPKSTAKDRDASK